MKPVIVIATLIFALVSGVIALFFLNQRRLVYFPDASNGDAIPPSFTLKRPDGVTLRGWVDDPGQPRALLYFGGNAETLQAARAELRECCPGWSRYFLPYRGYGGSEGAPASPAIHADALAFYDTVAKRHPGQPVALIGRSLGSGVAAHVAANRPVSKLVLVTPFDSLKNVAKAHYPWLPVGLLLRERYDSADWLRGKPLAAMVIRARHDQVIPAANTDALLRALPDDTWVVELEGDHNTFAEAEGFRQALADFLR
ncbi:alpha/beta hydrolase [Lysobacter pythonis]|uniref:Alpha/beta hydrolase n=1 Tax=Solilutibacter pythonis TaxID=2483112 RepID=A0A3M2I637_9GAMM|nr:alpha/beta fold hydrolase [Lysobacter pythonis]RMH94989.1 alpha/beta hydrolase [Lysobacter pythonis]